MFTIYTLHLLCYICLLYNKYAYPGAFLVFSKQASLAFFFFFSYFDNELEPSDDILHKVSLTKSLAMQPKLLAEQD